jgi:outer membrane beta-barrel protein
MLRNFKTNDAKNQSLSRRCGTRRVNEGTMKHARVWLVLAAALIVPTSAFAQKGNKKPPAAPAAGTTPAAAGEAEFDADKPAGDKPADGAAAPAEGDVTPPAGPSGGICDVDPTAPGCGKGPDVTKVDPERELNENKVWAVQQIYAMKKGRFELNPFWSFSLNDQFVSHPGPGVNANYYLSNVLAVGVNFNFYGGLNVDSEFNFQNRRATRVAVPLNEYLAAVSLDATYVPVYGKFGSIGDFIFHYDAYIPLGLGVLWTRPIPVIDPDNRKFSYTPKLAGNVGLGLRIFFNRWFAATLEVRNYIYSETVENTVIAKTQSEQINPKTWTDNNFNLTNNVQASLGVSIFLPFSFKYELAK